jgi:tetratricopeptide (TPR) repeat protein
MVHHFVLRQSLFKDITHELFGRTECPIVVLQGTGGSGKTQLAIDCCRQAEKNLRFIATFWIDASSTISVMRSYKAIASRLSKKVPDNSNQEILVSVVQDTLRELQHRWLVVFDNYDNPTAFKDQLITYYIPTGRNGSILFTSRCGDSARLGHYICIEVSKMTEQESRKLLLDGKPSNEEKEAQASMIASALGDFPLALDQAAAYIRSRHLPLRDFIPEYNKRKGALVKKMPGHWKYHMKMTEPEGEQALSVFTLLEMLLDLLEGTREVKHAKCRFLTLAAFFDNKLISERYFRVYCDAAKVQWMGIFRTENFDSHRMEYLLAEYGTLSLVQMPNQRSAKSDENQFSVHPLVCEWMKFRKKLDYQQTSIMEMATMLTNYLRTISFVDLPLHIRQETISHIDACILNEQIFCGEGLNIGLTAFSDSARHFASVYFEEGRYKQGKRLLEQALIAKVKKFGLSHLETLNATNDVCAAYIDMRQPKEAEMLLRLAVADCEKGYGTRHFETLRMVSNLAISYFEQERYNKAEKLFKRAVTSDDPTTKIQSAFNLLNCYRVQGRYDEAISLFRDTIAPSESMMGTENLEKMNSRYYLGSCYHGQGRYDEAAKIYEEVLAKYKECFGFEDSETQSVWEDLQVCHRSMNEDRGQ